MNESRSPFHFNPDSRLDKYIIRQLLARGKETEVYRALATDSRQDVAIKVFHPTATPETEACFRQKAQAFAALQHPNIIRVLDFAVRENFYYLVMEWNEGTNLRDLISDHPTGLSREDALRLFSQIAGAVATVHKQGVIHGNIKPDNVLLAADQRPLLSGFSLPCLVETSPETGAKGMPSYLSPEQAAGGAPGIPDDIYALGVLLYEMVTGDVPFKGDTPESVLAQHAQAAPIPPSQINVGLDPRIDQAILKALNKAPTGRYAAVQDMLHDLESPAEKGQFETLTLQRSAMAGPPKRRSEIMRFQTSRIDEPRVVPRRAFFPLRGPYLLLLIAGIVFLTVFLIGLVFLLL